jgi:hypothetical protein
MTCARAAHLLPLPHSASSQAAAARAPARPLVLIRKLYKVGKTGFKMYTERLLVEDQMSNKAMSSLQQCVGSLKRTKSRRRPLRYPEEPNFFDSIAVCGGFAR